MSYSYQSYGCGCQPRGCQPYTAVCNPIVFPTNACGPICVYENIYQLRMETTLTQNRVAMTKGQYAAYDTNGHIYIFEASNTSADDDVNIIKPNIIPADQPGRWRIWM